jgi:hypothetical protein
MLVHGDNLGVYQLNSVFNSGQYLDVCTASDP